METVNLKSHILKYGLIIGAIGLIWMFGIYAIDLYLMLNMGLNFVPMLFYIGIVTYAGFELRKAYGGFLSFKDAFVSTFLIFIVAAVISTLGTVLLYTVIDPSLPGTLAEAQMEKMAGMFSRMGMSQDKIDEAIAAQKDANPYSIANILMGMLFILAFYAIISLIVAAIVKKKRVDFV